MAKFAEISPDGFPLAFYSPDIHGDDIPLEAIEITDENWLEFINNAGRRRWDGGKVVEYTPPGPTAEEQRALMHPLEKWRFDTIIDSRPGLRDKIETAIERNIPDLLQRATVRNKFRSVTQFSRLDPMFPFLASDPDINISDLEIDEMWRQGLALT